MNKTSLAILVAASLVSSIALAGQSTVFIGYAQSKIQGFDTINGVNAKYRYEFDSPLSLIGSFTWMQGNGDDYLKTTYIAAYDEVTVKYYSVLAGPAYRFNDYVSLYTVLGAARLKADGHSTRYTASGTSRSDISGKSTSFAWGAGLMMNPSDHFSVSVGYEGTEANIYDNQSVNGFNVGLGYRF